MTKRTVLEESIVSNFLVKGGWRLERAFSQSSRELRAFKCRQSCNRAATEHATVATVRAFSDRLSFRYPIPALTPVSVTLFTPQKRKLEDYFLFFSLFYRVTISFFEILANRRHTRLQGFRVDA
eukprot:09286_4